MPREVAREGSGGAEQVGGGLDLDHGVIDPGGADGEWEVIAGNEDRCVVAAAAAADEQHEQHEADNCQAL